MVDIDIEKKSDWSRALIIFEIHEKGSSLRKLSIANGLKPDTVKFALHKSYPKAEKIIADFIGVDPSDIWPSRYLDTQTGTDK